MSNLGLAIAYEAFYQIIAGQHLSQGLILPRQHFLNTKFPSVLTVEQAILLAGRFRNVAVAIPAVASPMRPTGFGQ